jgi:hypothetical protein
MAEAYVIAYPPCEIFENSCMGSCMRPYVDLTQNQFRPGADISRVPRRFVSGQIRWIKVIVGLEFDICRLVEQRGFKNAIPA